MPRSIQPAFTGLPLLRAAPARDGNPLLPARRWHMNGKIIRFPQLADEFGVSRERVRQIEARAFEKVAKGGQEPRRRD